DADQLQNLVQAGTAGQGDDLVPVALQHQTEEVAKIVVVVDHQNARHGLPSAAKQARAWAPETQRCTGREPAGRGMGPLYRRVAGQRGDVCTTRSRAARMSGERAGLPMIPLTPSRRAALGSRLSPLMPTTGKSGARMRSVWMTPDGASTSASAAWSGPASTAC